MHDMTNPVFCENKINIINLSSAESAQRVGKIQQLGREMRLMSQTWKVSLRGLDTAGRTAFIFDKGDNFDDFWFAFLHTNTICKRFFQEQIVSF